MSGILPNNGVGPGSTQNGLDAPTLSAGCENLYYAPRCNPRLDPFAQNALISELLNAINSVGVSYDCTRLDNLALALATLAPPAPVTGSPNAVLQHRLPSGTVGGAFAASAWVTRPLNNESYDPGNIVSLLANQFTVAVNTFIEWDSVLVGTDHCTSRIFNVTDGAVTDVGLSSMSRQPDSGERPCSINTRGTASLVAGKTYRLEVYRALDFGHDFPDQAFGMPVGAGVDELYATVKFWRR
jgi:hypothetical protein